jgi:hypothetical protein
MPPTMLNKLLLWIFSLESSWAGKMSMPFGLSIVIVATRPRGDND